MSASGDEQNTECPLCMEPLELDDLNFFPCTCGYQICRFCWHRIRTDENGLCPACRKQYPEDPADFKPLTHEELQRIKSEKRQKDLQRKQKISDNRKHLGNVRVVQKNLVFVVGLSQRLAEPEVLKRNEYFGKFGKIHKVVINHSTSYAGSQGPSASAYVTYCRVEDSLRAIQAVNNIHVDGRTLKASLGTTKYCSHFLKGQQCPKGDCMYLHEIGDDAASFTKEEMQQGKHQEYEKKLHEQLFSNTRKQTLSPTLGTSVSTSGDGSGGVGNGRDSESSTSSSNNSGGSANGESVKSGRVKGQNKKDGGSNKSSKRTANSGEEPKRSNKAKSSSENQRNGRSRGSSKRGSSPSQKSSSEPSSSSVGGDDNVTVSDTCSVPNFERTSPDTSPTPPPNPVSIDPLPVNATDDSCSLSVGDQFSSLQTSTNGTQSPAQSLTNLDSSSSSAASSLSSSSTDVMQPFFRSRNGFSPLPEPNLLAPQLESTSLDVNYNGDLVNEWMCSSPTQDTSSVAQLEPVSTQGSTDWQAAFGFTSVQNKDDDLGFDPWDESSKALADLMEKETHNGVPFCPPSTSSSSSSASMLLNRNNLPYGQVDVVNPLRPLPTRIQQHQQQQQQHHQHLINGGRHIGAPPGFTPNLVGNSYNIGNQIPTDSIGTSKLLSLMRLAQHHQMQQQQQLQQQQQQQQPQVPPLVNGHHNHHHLHHHSHPHPNLHHPYSGESLLNLPKANHIKDIQGNQSKSQDSFNVKEWQDNLRPLFPNVNITFGSANGVQRQQQQQQPIPQHKGWSSSNSSAESSWLTQDPAVLSAGNVTTVRSDSPPHWMRSLQQLTEVDLPYNNHRLPVVNHYTYRNSQWVNPTQIPPPGFSNSLRQTHKPTEAQKMIDNF